jgi:hypothetical protein
MCTKLVHEVCNGIFYPIYFGIQLYLAQYITKRNKLVVTKHKVQLRLSDKVKLDLYELVNFKNKIGFFKFYLYGLNLPTYNLFTYIKKPTYLIEFNNYLSTYVTRVNILLAINWTI